MFVCIGQIRAFLPVNISMKQVPDDAIKILSYNVMFYDSHQPHTEESPNEIVRYIQNSNADIVCLQEASFNNSNSKKFLSEKVFRKALSTYPYFSFHKEKGSGWVCLSRFPILSTRSIPYESVGNGTVAYELKVGNDTLLLVNNHLESNKLSIDDRAAYRDMIIDPKEDKVKTTSKMLIGKVADAVSIRASQADSVAKFIQDSKHKYVVVCGDFNDSSLSYAHRVIGKGLNDAFVDTGNGLGVSYNRYGFYFRIDHIMASENLDLFNCQLFIINFKKVFQTVNKGIGNHFVLVIILDFVVILLAVFLAYLNDYKLAAVLKHFLRVIKGGKHCKVSAGVGLNGIKNLKLVLNAFIINQGDKIRIDTRTGEYMERA